jgi:CheY-like chemotaxis protein
MAQILIAEDEKDIRELVGFTLKLIGHSSLLAGNGQEALDLLNSNQVDLILMDLRMPVLAGKEAAEKIKNNPTTCNIPIIFMTAKDQDPAITGEIANGVEYISKPFSVDLLQKKVTEVLSSQSI